MFSGLCQYLFARLQLRRRWAPPTRNTLWNNTARIINERSDLTIAQSQKRTQRVKDSQPGFH